jgi:predicted glycoside hydrolase/deacetylase ChbG (UPF0249 family)
MRRLIVNADDFGRARGVNAGVLRAHRDGIVTAATLMVTTPGTDDAARIARTTPSLDVGLHLTLTFGRPVSDAGMVPSLVEPDGSFPRAPSAFLGTSRANRDEAALEYRAQFARARELIGREPTHLDSHHWLHDEPALEWAVAALARETGTAVRPHDDAQRDRLRAAGIRTVADLGDGVTELGCHPGEPDPELERTSTYAALRVTELATLTDPRAKDAIARAGVALADYAAVP